jgi:hypothetical protein
MKKEKSFKQEQLFGKEEQDYLSNLMVGYCLV